MIARRLTLFAFVLVGCAAPSVDEPEAAEDLEFATEEALQPPPEAPAPEAIAPAPDATGGGAEGTPAAAPAPPPPSTKSPVTFGRATKERRYGVFIKDAAHKAPRVIYSVKLPKLSATETLRVRGEVSLSRCSDTDIAGNSGDSKHTPCNSQEMKKNPYNYAPRIQAIFVVSDKPNDPKGIELGGWIDHTCSAGQHHCAVPLPEVIKSGLPNAAEKYLNLIVAADAPGSKANSWDVMEVEQSKGGVYVTRIAPGAGSIAIEEKSNAVVANGKHPLDQPKEDGDPTQVKRIAFRVKLVDLRPGDVIDIDGRMRAVLHMSGNLNCDPLITSQVFLTKQEDDTEGSGDGEEHFTAKNGRNCVDHSNGGCDYEKSASVQIGKNANSTMYVNYVAIGLKSCVQNGDEWSIADGLLHARVRR